MESRKCVEKKFIWFNQDGGAVEEKNCALCVFFGKRDYWYYLHTYISTFLIEKKTNVGCLCIIWCEEANDEQRRDRWWCWKSPPLLEIQNRRDTPKVVATAQLQFLLFQQKQTRKKFHFHHLWMRIQMHVYI